MKIKTIILLGILLTLSIFTMASCVASTSATDTKDADTNEPNTKDPLLPSDVSAANCADATAALNCFVSKWDTTKTGNGASATNVVVLPLVGNGEYNFYVDWGDGTAIENITAKAPHTHEYKDEGEYTIQIAGEIKGWRFFVSEASFGDAVKLLDVSQWGSLSLGNTDGRQFQGAANFNPTASDAPNLSETTSLAAAFQGATVFNGAIGNWDVSTVTTMASMFRLAFAFDQDLSKWNVSTVTTMESMFRLARAFDQDLSKWNVSAVSDMGFMFEGASTFNSPLVWAGKTQNVTSMVGMFSGTPLFNQNISGWDVSAVTTMESMFEGAAAFDRNLSRWNVSAVTNMDRMFRSARAFNSPLVWDERTQNVTTMESMFSGTTFFNQDISGWDVSAVTSMVAMFQRALAYDRNLSGWNVSAVTSMAQMFDSASTFNSPLVWDEKTQKVTSMRQMFERAPRFNQDIGGWNVSSVDDMANMFSNARAFDRNLSKWNVSAVSDMGFMFSDAITFNSPLAWDEKTQNVTNMQYMFENARTFKQDIGGWNISAVGNMEGMFSGASTFNSPLSWADKTRNVTNMAFMFRGAALFDQDLSKWNVSPLAARNGFDDGTPTTWTAAEKPDWSLYCADATAALNCFISKWDTRKTGTGASATDTVVLPLVDNGEYNFYVDWGDGTAIEHITAKAPHTHEYEDEGEYTIQIAGEIKGWRFFVSEASFGDAVKLLDVSQWGSLSLGNTDGRQFRGAKNFNPTASDAPNLSETTSLAAAFSGASNFNGAIGNWDVSTITTMESMFWNVKKFERNLSKWGQKTKNVTSMASMFEGASNFNAPIGNWDVSAVTTMEKMFAGTTYFNKDLSNWDVSAVTTMERMFWNAVAFNSPLVWGERTRNVTNMENMFLWGAEFDQDISGWNVSAVTNMRSMFQHAVFKQDISEWNVCNVIDWGNFDAGTYISWTAAEKPNWGMDCPTN